MIKTRNDGLSLHDYIPTHLKDMFYHNPDYTPGGQLDPYGFMTRGLVLYLPLWALKDSSFKSVDAYKHACTVTGALWRPQGRYFDGTDKLIDCGTPAPLQFTTDTHIAVWVKLDGVVGLQTLCAKSNVSAEDRFIFRTSDTNIQCFKESANDGGITVTGNDAALTTGWHFVELSFGSGGYHTYYDLTLDGTNADTNALTAGTDSSFFIGSDYAGANDLAGYIGELLVYNRILSAGERAHNYNCTVWRYQ